MNLPFIKTVGVSGLVSGVQTGMVAPAQALTAFRAIGKAIETQFPADGSLQELRALIGVGAVSPEANNAILTRIIQQSDSVELAVRLAMRADAIGASMISSAAAVVGIEAPAVVGIDAPIDLSNYGLVWIPAGEFMMGSANDDPYAYDDEKPLRRVMVPGFWIGRIVSNGEWRSYLQEHGKTDDRDLREEFAGDKKPAVGIDQGQAAAYSVWYGKKLSTQVGYPLIGSLPTEKQWEKMAKGKFGTQFITPATHAQAHFDAQATREVDHPDVFIGDNGVVEPLGNVWVWTSSSRYKEGSANFVLRGGSWCDNIPQYLRAACRNDFHPVERNVNIGFRPVVSPQDSAK